MAKNKKVDLRMWKLTEWLMRRNAWTAFIVASKCTQTLNARPLLDLRAKVVEDLSAVKGSYAALSMLLQIIDGTMTKFPTEDEKEAHNG